MKRVLTALLLIPAVLAIIVLAPDWAFLTVVALVAALCFREYARLVEGHGIERPGPLGYAAGLLALLLPAPDLPVLTLLALVTMAVALRYDDFAKSLPYSACLVTGVLYVFGAWRCGIHLRHQHPAWLVYALALNWVGDTAALYAGRAFGRHKMAPRASPKKTWEGAAASLAASTLFGWFFLSRTLPQVPAWHAVALSMAASVAGQIGDLAESAVKRGAQLKDSGTSLPGHGGWLDRVDSTLFAMPVVYFYLRQGL